MMQAMLEGAEGSPDGQAVTVALRALGEAVARCAAAGGECTVLVLDMGRDAFEVEVLPVGLTLAIPWGALADVGLAS
jgi:hypothetical protein